MSKKSQKNQVYDFIKENPGIRVQEIADKLDIYYISANNAVRKLWYENKITLSGGGWRVAE